jgi:hypothetical protein
MKSGAMSIVGDTSGFNDANKAEVNSSYLQFSSNLDLSDISPLFEVDDIFTCTGSITGLMRCS